MPGVIPFCQEYTPHEKRQYCLWQFVSQYTIKCYEQIPYFIARVDKVGYHCELLYEAHDSTFGILEIYHCWRFQGSGVIAALQIIGFIFFCTGMHHEYFLGRQCAFVFPIYVRKYRKYTIDRWIVVYKVCASAVISPLKQWLDSYA